MLLLTFLGSAAMSSAVAFDMPKPKKDKKNDTSTNASTSTSTKTDSTNATTTDDTKKTDATAPAPATTGGDATPPPAAPVAAPPAQVMEVKTIKSAWDKGGLDGGKVGDYVEYDYPSVPGGYHVRMELIEKGDHTTTTLNQTTMGTVKSESKMKMIYSEPDPVVPGKTPEQIKEAGR